MRDAFELALDHLGRKLGGLYAAVVYEDDQLKPEIGRQKTEKIIQSDKVNFLTGYVWSNVLLASLKSAVEAQSSLSALMPVLLRSQVSCVHLGFFQHRGRAIRSRKPWANT